MSRESAKKQFEQIRADLLSFDNDNARNLCQYFDWVVENAIKMKTTTAHKYLSIIHHITLKLKEGEKTLPTIEPLDNIEPESIIKRNLVKVVEKFWPITTNVLFS